MLGDDDDALVEEGEEEDVKKLDAAILRGESRVGGEEGGEEGGDVEDHCLPIHTGTPDSHNHTPRS